MAFQKIISELFETIVGQILTFLLTFLLITVIVPLLLVIMPPLFLTRRFVSILSKILRPDLGKMLSATSTVMSTDDINANPKLAATLVSHFTGKLDIDAIKSKMVNEVIGVRKVRGELKNVECKQYPHKWMGFVFWKWDKKFDISNHIKLYQNGIHPGSKISMERVHEIEHELLFKPFPEKRSPWDATIFHNVESESGEEETAIIFRFHHSIADGYSLLKLLSFEILDEIPKEFIPNPVFPRKSCFQQLSFYLKCLLAPYLFAELFVESFDRNKWKIPEKKLSPNWVAKVSDEVSVDVIKEAKGNLNVSVTTVIFAAVTAALRRAMLKKNGRVPKNIHTGMVFPMKFHADKLRNVLVVVFLKLPVGEKDPIRRLKMVDQNLNKLKNSPIPYMAYGLTILIGSMFHWMIQPLLHLTPPTAGGSTFPGPKTQLKFLGYELIDTHFAMGPLFGNIGVAFTTLTCNNIFQARFMVNRSILDKQTEVEEITKDIVEEIYVLQRCANSVV